MVIYHDLPIKNGDLPIKNCDLPIKNGDLPIKNGDLPIKNGDFPLTRSSYPNKSQLLEPRNTSTCPSALLTRGLPALGAQRALAPSFA